MVSGTLSPLISFFDVSYLVSFVVRGQRPRRGRWPMVPPHRRASGGLEPAGRALEPAGRSSEPAGITLEQGWAIQYWYCIAYPKLDHFGISQYWLHLPIQCQYNENKAHKANDASSCWWNYCMMTWLHDSFWLFVRKYQFFLVFDKSVTDGRTDGQTQL